MKRLVFNLGMILIVLCNITVNSMLAQESVALRDWKELPEVIKSGDMELIKFVADEAGRTAFFNACDSKTLALLDFHDEPAIFNAEFDHYFADKPLAYWVKDTLSGQFIGCFSIHQVLMLPYERGDLCYWIATDFRGHGRAVEALKLISREYFKAMPERSCYKAQVLASNTRSIEILEKFGFEVDQPTDLVIKDEDGRIWVQRKLTRENFFAKYDKKNE